MNQSIVQLAVESKAWRDGEEILRDLAFTVQAAETVCVIGPSGAGKSTLLGILAGVDPDFTGRLCVNIADAPGVMFQQPRLMPWLTVFDNVLLGVSKRTAPVRQRASDLLDAFGLAHIEHHYPLALSLGMQRRVALARALLPKPELLLLDEPFVSLDAPAATSARTVLQHERQSAGAAAIVFTHDLREAVELGDRLLFLSTPPARVLLEVRPDRRARCDPAGYCEELLEHHPQLLAGSDRSQLRLAK